MKSGAGHPRNPRRSFGYAAAQTDLLLQSQGNQPPQPTGVALLREARSDAEKYMTHMGANFKGAASEDGVIMQKNRGRERV